MDKLKTKRNPFWDSLKVFLIFMVVYGHMIETCVDNSLFNQATYNFIYLFHMPLFVFITGRFSHIKDRRKNITRMLTIFETYIVFQFIRCSKSLFFDGHLSIFPDILIPKGILWYLACLLLWRLIVLTARDYIERYKLFFLLLFFATGIGIGFILVPDGTVIRFFTLGFFFFMGYYIKDSWMDSLFHKIPSWTAFTLIISLWLFIFFVVNTDIRSVIYYGSYYDNPPISPYLYLWARLFLYIFAIITSFLLMRIVYAKPLFSSYGNCTLSIFMFHIFIVMALRPLLANGFIPNNEILLFIISLVICFSLAWLTQHLKIMTIMLNPISYIINKSKSDSK